MKKRALLISVYLCLLLGFVCGAAELGAAYGERVSESENRMLQGMPALSADAVRSGRFMDEMESYLSDGFFFRDESARFSEALMGVFSLPDDTPDSGEIDQELLFAPAESDAPEEVSAPEEAAPSGETAPAPVEGPSKIDASLLSDASFYLVDREGERRVLISYPAAELASFAELLNRYRAALPEDGRLVFAVPPVSAVANTLLGSEQYTDWGSDVDEILNGVVDEGVLVCDAAEILRPYFGKERLYPVIDHHWQPVSASLVASEMLRQAGVVPVDYYEYRYYLSTSPSFGPYTEEELRAMSYSIDAVEVMEPVSPVEAYLLHRLDERLPGIFIDRSLGGLMSYLGGLNGPWRLFVGGFHTGRSALVIGDSFELTFTPFLIPYYDRVLVTDLRDSTYNPDLAGASIREYIETYGVDDIYMLYSTYSPFCGEAVQSHLARYLDGT